MASGKKKEKKEDSKVGGFAFFLSLLALIPSSALVIFLAARTWHYDSMPSIYRFALGMIIGSAFAFLFIRGRFSVYLHELKHSILSNLVGNEPAGMEVNNKDGHFEYKYTASTAQYNAMISLAPYCLPIMTCLGFVIGLSIFYAQHEMAALCVGIGYGADLVLNIRDISPVQTDINLIRGGYKIGLSYILIWNLVIAGLIAIWIFDNMADFKLAFF